MTFSTPSPSHPSTPPPLRSFIPYRAVLSARFRMLLQYRAAAFAGLVTQVFWGWIRVMIFEAFYASTDVPQPMNIAEIITYVWLGQALLRFLPWDVDSELRGMIRTGGVAYEMLRPVDLYNFWFSRVLAYRLAPTLLRAVPMVAMAMLFFGMELPPTVASGAAWVLTTFGALMLSCAMTVLMTVTLMWTISGEGIYRLLPGLIILFSGMAIPLPFFPDWLQPLLNALPFRGFVDVPFRLYTGNLPPESALPLFLHQMLWATGLVLVGRWLMSRGMRRLVVQGG